MIKIAFMGNIGSGKSTAAEYLADVYLLEPISFADEVKMELVSIGVNPDRLFTTKDKTARELMQAYATAMREQDEDYWLKIVQAVLEAWTRHDIAGVVIDDLRYPNEYEALRKDGFIFVRILNTSAPNVSSHASETSLTNYKADFTIETSGKGTDKLYAKLDEIMNKLEEQDA